MLEIGRICVKTAGREAGRYCVVVAKEKEKDFLLVTGPKNVTHVRRRKCNFRHLEPTPFKIEIKENATDEDVMKVYEKEDIFAKLKITRPGAEQTKLAEERREKRAEAKEAKEKESEESKEEHRKEEERKEAKHGHEKKEEHKGHKPAHKEEKPKKARAKKAASKKTKKE